VQEARAQWEDGLNKELQEIARERAEPLARPRPPGENENGDADNGNSRVSPQAIGCARRVEHIGGGKGGSSLSCGLLAEAWLAVCRSGAGALLVRLGGPAGGAGQH
jgi:hypothetical protein